MVLDSEVAVSMYPGPCTSALVIQQFANWKIDKNGPFIVDLPIKHGDFPVRKLWVYQNP